MSDAKDRTRDRVQRAAAAVEDAQHHVEEMTRLSDPTPAASVDEAAEQASSLRAAIDRDLDALQSRLPPREELAAKARTYGGALLGALAVIAALVIRLKQRGERKRLERDARAHAEAIARYLPGASTRPVDASTGRGGKSALVALALVAAAVAAFVVSRQTGGNEPDIWGPPR